MIKLFCLPYAGGSSTIFSGWKRFLDASVELVALELPGHGTRMSEPLLNHAGSVTEDLLSKQNPIWMIRLCHFGHSMGSPLAYELQKKLTMENKQPIHMFFPGVSASYPGKESASSAFKFRFKTSDY